MLKFDKMLCSLIEKNSSYIYMFFVFLVSCLVRCYLLDEISGDMVYCLLPWFQSLQENGGLAALKLAIGDYNIPYLFLLALMTYLPFEPSDMIKIVSIVFDYVTAFLIPVLVYRLILDQPGARAKVVLLYTLLCLNPIMILNSAWWGQCDIIYSLFMILSILFCSKEKYTLGIIFFGIAFAFKLQAVFILPVLLCLYVRQKKFSLLSFLIVPAVNFILCLPAIIAGRPLTETMTIYFRQTSSYEYMTLNYPNVYYLLSFPYNPFNQCAILFGLTVVGIGIIYIIHKQIAMNTHNILYLSIWTIWSCVMFLPSMHERYGFCMEILLLIYVAMYGKEIVTTLLLNFVVLSSYSSYMFGTMPFDRPVFSLINLIIYFSFTIRGFMRMSSMEDGPSKSFCQCPGKSS